MFLIALVVYAAPVAAQDTLRIHRLTGPIVLDGQVDEPAWQEVPVVPITLFSPQYRAEPTERTELRVAYDDAYLYVSGRLYDSSPRSVRTNTLYRDAYSGDDLLGIVLDTYNDHQTGSWFVVNPAGVRTDRSLSNDAEMTNGMPMNPDWNAFWDVVTSQNGEGWFAEMRIPFSSLGFQDVNGRVVMGMALYRFIARKNERQIYPDIPPSAGGLAFAKPSRMQRVVLEGVYRRQPVYVAPYGLGGWRRNAALNDASTAYDVTRAYTGEAGLDVRYSPTSNLSLDLTANTDFAQVEADDQQVNLTRFSLFFPEKRQFFQERASIFDFGMGGFSRLFHSRRIGLVDGQPIRLLGGVRLVGRIGGADLGVLNMQTAAAAGQPSENFGVARVRQQVLNPYSTLGGMITTRVGEDGGDNVATGVDAVIRPVGDEYVTVKAARTFEGGAGGPSLAAATRVLLGWERRTQGGLSYSAEAIRSGAAYNPGIGFELRSDFTSLGGYLQYLWFTGPETPFRSLAVNGGGLGFRRNNDGTTESGSLGPGLRAEFKNGGELNLKYRANYESVLDSFDLTDGVPVPPAAYWFHEGELAYRAPLSTSFRPSFVAVAGQFYGGYRVSFTANPAWNPSRHLELGVDYGFNAIRFPDRELSVDVHLLRLRVQTAYDAHLSLSTFWQYNSATDVASVNARLRYNVREGNDLWVVYNEAVNTDRLARSPIPPVSQGRAVMAKYTHTMVW
ncbi:MAG: hypothetical protein A2W29_08950 [Gemmatimonadetes bacterium RBG_16_66_8]|nr:MAG: hypothetical protein A2W29_08950 [Gemmatimonadetes bacterium RBG_16_66_8]